MIILCRVLSFVLAFLNIEVLPPQKKDISESQYVRSYSDMITIWFS